jgi:hypothetical protein
MHVSRISGPLLARLVAAATAFAAATALAGYSKSAEAVADKVNRSCRAGRGNAAGGG